MALKKVLLMGKSGAGKTSMRSIIFANYLARDTMRLCSTIDVEHSHVRFLGNLVLNLWDCGGQEDFVENYFNSQRDHIFRNVQVLIYVFDIESTELQKDMHYFTSCLEALQHNSADAKIFVMVHKMDMIPEERREAVFRSREAELKKVAGEIGKMDVHCFQTSIWDETLYKAWSTMVYSLVPNASLLERHLSALCTACCADELVLFERATFLVISQAVLRGHADPHRFEKISNIVKQFKLSCSKTQAQFASMQVHNPAFSAYIEGFTSNTYLMVITSDPAIKPAMTLLNLHAAKATFEDLLSHLGDTPYQEGDGQAQIADAGGSAPGGAAADARGQLQGQASG